LRFQLAIQPVDVASRYLNVGYGQAAQTTLLAVSEQKEKKIVPIILVLLNLLLLEIYESIKEQVA